MVPVPIHLAKPMRRGRASNTGRALTSYNSIMLMEDEPRDGGGRGSADRESAATARRSREDDMDSAAPAEHADASRAILARPRSSASSRSARSACIAALIAAGRLLLLPASRPSCRSATSAPSCSVVSFVGIIAIGQTILLVAGEFDLSVGSVAGLSAVVARQADDGAGPAGAARHRSAASGVGALIGLVNGLVVVKLQHPRLHPDARHAVHRPGPDPGRDQRLSGLSAAAGRSATSA